jgi:uncharacterized repeat protein (TIGR01451 family)
VINGTTYLLVDQFGSNGGYQHVQDAINAASGAATILIAPGTYTESGSDGIGHTVGLYINKANLTLQGVDANGAAITTSAGAVANGATIISGHQAGFGANHWVDFGGDNTIIQGLHLQAGAETNNKLLEIWGNNVTVENSFIDIYKGGTVDTQASAIYLNDNGTASSEIDSYAVSGNVLNGAIVVANGVGDPSTHKSLTNANDAVVDTAGEVIEYTITVDNTGNVDLTGVVLDDAFAGGATLVSGDVGNDGILGVNETWTYSADYVVTQADLNAGRNLVNVAGVDTDQTGRQTDSVAYTIGTPPPNPTLNLEKDVAGIIGGTVDGKVDSAGDVIQYALTVQNTGNMTLTGIQVLDPFADPGSIHLIVDAASADGQLNVGELWHYTATHTVTQVEIDSNGGGDGMLENTAIAFSDQTVGNPDSASASVAVEEPCIPVDLLAFQGSFEGTVLPPGQPWTTRPIAGWQNLGSPTNAIETWRSEFLAQQTDGHLSAFGNFVVETDSTGSLNTDPAPGATDPVGLMVNDVFVAHVDACEGEIYQISLNYTSRNIPPSNTDSFDVYWNGGLVGHFDPADSLQNGISLAQCRSLVALALIRWKSGKPAPTIHSAPSSTMSRFSDARVRTGSTPKALRFCSS